MRLRPFFTFYGGKHRIAKHYPPPEHDTIVEPFAGSAGYSTLYYDRDVVLYDVDEYVAGVWDYLINAKRSEVLDLPLLGPQDCVDSLCVPQEAKWLIGFWLNKGVARPRRRPSAWMRSGIRPGSFWGEQIRSRIAAQADRIRHWRIFYGSYQWAEDIEATWFVDPPYAGAGKHYRHSMGEGDLARLGAWCTERRGLVIACENSGASWLPFRDFVDAKANESKHGGKVSREAIYVQRRAA